MPSRQYFPQELIELQQEVLMYHPKLAQDSESAASDYTHNLGVMAAYVGIEVDGLFDDAEITKLAGLILVRLIAMRTIQVH